jgi:hypothetical protein
VACVYTALIFLREDDALDNTFRDSTHFDEMRQDRPSIVKDRPLPVVSAAHAQSGLVVDREDREIALLDLLAMKNGRIANHSPTRRTRNALLTYGVGYSSDQIQPMINSFQQYTTAQDDVIYFVKASLLDQIRQTLRVLRPENVHLLPCPKEFEPDVFFRSRWNLLEAWAQANHQHYQTWVVCDARDLFFQESPFAAVDSLGGTVHRVFLLTERGEHQRPLLIKDDQKWNFPWLEGCIGHKLAHEFAFLKQPCPAVLNGGVMIGSSKVIAAWIKLISSFLRTHLNCVDQAAIS